MTPAQVKSVQELKKKLSKHWKSDASFCALCPSECATDPRNASEHWHCALINAEICEVCCTFDMDGEDWPRGRWPGICKDIACKNYKEENTVIGLINKGKIRGEDKGRQRT